MKVNFINDNCNIVNNGKTNMELDLKLLNGAIKNNSDEIFVRFYQWYPRCISLGRNQKDINFNSFDIDVVTRPTGGRALLHERELTYCFVSRCLTSSVIESYKLISDALISGFSKLGINLEYAKHENKNYNYCMNISSGADISYLGKKFIGSAQYRRQNYLLQHGSIPYSLDYELIEKIFSQKIEKNSIITLNEITDELNIELTTAKIIEALKQGFLEKFQ